MLQGFGEGWCEEDTNPIMGLEVSEISEESPGLSQGRTWPFRWRNGASFPWQGLAPVPFGGACPGARPGIGTC